MEATHLKLRLEKPYRLIGEKVEVEVLILAGDKELLRVDIANLDVNLQIFDNEIQVVSRKGNKFYIEGKKSGNYNVRAEYAGLVSNYVDFHILPNLTLEKKIISTAPGCLHYVQLGGNSEYT